MEQPQIQQTPLEFFQRNELSSRACAAIVQLVKERFGDHVEIHQWKQKKTESGWQSRIRVSGSRGKFVELARFIEDQVDLPEHQLRAEAGIQRAAGVLGALRLRVSALLNRA